MVSPYPQETLMGKIVERIEKQFLGCSTDDLATESDADPFE